MRQLPLLRRLDHVAIVVRDTSTALTYFTGSLGLNVVHTDLLEVPPLILTYLDAGNALVQLIEPLNGSTDVARWLQENGEGLHHICFGVTDVPVTAAELSKRQVREIVLGQGFDRTSAFVPNGAPHGVTIELTELRAST